MEKIGVFLCTGCDIGKAFELDPLQEAAEEENVAVFEKHECFCGEEGLALINDKIEGESLDGVVIAACSHLVKTEEFSFDPMKVSTVRVSLREQVAWSQPHGEEDTQMLAVDLLQMGLARAGKNELPKLFEAQIDETIMVVGGGLTGLNAAQAAAGLGKSVVLVEKENKLGGYLADIKDLIPEVPPYNTLHSNKIGELIGAVKENSDIRMLLDDTIKATNGQPGQFDVEMNSGEKFRVGAIVQATGATPYDANNLTNLNYGKSDKIVTSTEFEKLLAAGNLSGSRIVFVQCAGSRDENHLSYCSGECCGVTLKQVAAVHRDFPQIECAVIYRDMRTPGQLEHFYLAVQEQDGSLFTRGDVDAVEVVDDGLKVKISQSLLGDEAVLDADLVVLATGMIPTAADSESIRELVDAKARIAKNESETQVAEATKMVERLKHHEGTEILNLGYRQGPDLPVLKYNFPDSHYICFPYETRRTGIYAAGALHAPMDVAQAVEDAYGATMKAVQCVSALTRGEAVHPRSGDIAIADFFMQRCTQCKRCTEECPFGAINEDEKGTPEYNELRCRKCGICLGSCPERIISFPEYSVDGTASMIKAFEVPDEFDEKPRIIAFMCENDALPALDAAAKNGIKLSPWVRIIPVRCLGACNTVWIADSLSRGIDGILLLGCKRGDDYQCHYIQGSELANTRMTNVKETLERLTLESERVQIHELGRDEFSRVVEVINTFAEEIEELDPNPYKGF
jgi:quinone-modifying oxidoreductase, subunit QmoB